MSYLLPALLVLCTLPLVISLWRANELFVLRAAGGRLERVRGRIPPGLLADLADVLARAGVRHVELRGVAEGGHATVRLRGAEPGPAVRQQLRNAIALWPLAKIRQSARTPRG